MISRKTNVYRKLRDMINDPPRGGAVPAHIPKSLAYCSGGDAPTIYAGTNRITEGFLYTGDGTMTGSINANVTNVVDITNPSTWTTLIDINKADPFGLFFLKYAENSALINEFHGFRIVFSSATGAGVHMRMRITIDGTVVFDRAIQADGTNTIQTGTALYEKGSEVTRSAATRRRISSSPLIYCRESFKFEVARQGDCSSGTSYPHIRCGVFSYSNTVGLARLQCMTFQGAT